MGSVSTASLNQLYAIPAEYESKLEYVPEEQIDSRSDAEILESLKQHAPVTSEKNVWAFWDKGVDAMPGWCLRNVMGWVRILGSEWTVRVLDSVPDSANHVLKFVPEELLPETMVQGTMDGPYVGAHSADFVRTAVIYVHGGVWQDVGNVLIRHLDRIAWDQLADPANPYQIAVGNVYDQLVTNSWFAARKNDPFIKAWHTLFTEIWKGRTNCKGVVDHPLMNTFMSVDEMLAMVLAIGLPAPSVDNKWVAEYLAQFICWCRTARLDPDSESEFKGADYWETKILTIDGREEMLPSVKSIGSFDNQRLFDLLSMRVDVADKENNPDYQAAHRMVWNILSEGSMEKVIRAKKMYPTDMLGGLWDKPENHTKDHEEGTFAGLLRYGTVHFRQKRDTIKVLPAAPVAQRLKKGVLEA